MDPLSTHPSDADVVDRPEASVSRDPVLLAARDRLVRALKPVRLVVFGSRARGEGRPDSDVDLMVVADLSGSLAERARAVYRHLLDLPVSFDLVIYTPDEYERLRTWRTSVAGIADREGVVLHGCRRCPLPGLRRPPGGG